MTGWIETYRGAVPPWQCDVTEHFTIGYYFDRLEEAQANLADVLGIADLARRGDVPRRINARFAKELRAGAGFHIESAALAADSGVRLGHRVLDSTSGEPVTWFEEFWEVDRNVTEPLGVWNGPETERRGDPTTSGGFFPTARGRVKTADVNAAGQFAMGAMVLRFSNASGQLGTAIGMDAAFMQQQRRGFSTFELVLKLSGALPLDAPYLVETAIGLFGNSSMRMIHRMTDPRSGQEIAQLSQYGVNLDLDARRPARWPDDIRTRAQARLVEVS